MPTLWFIALTVRWLEVICSVPGEGEEVDSFKPPKNQAILNQLWITELFIYLRLNEAKQNERDDKWFLEFPSETVECESVLIVKMCEV